MDTALLLILPLVGGYIFASTWNVSRYRSAREDGHRLYFRAAFYAAFLLICAHLLRLLFTGTIDGYTQFESSLTELLSPFSKTQEGQSVILITSLYALTLGVVLSLPLNRVFRKELFLKLAIRDNDLDRLLYSAAVEPMPISLTMDNRKVYVGFVVTTIDPTTPRKALTILPLMSGYREENGGKIIFTTYYERVYELLTDETKRLDHLSVDHFRIVLPIDRIHSANMFDVVAYAQFSKQEPARKPKRRKTKAAKSRNKASSKKPGATVVATPE